MEIGAITNEKIVDLIFMEVIRNAILIAPDLIVFSKTGVRSTDGFSRVCCCEVLTCKTDLDSILGTRGGCVVNTLHSTRPRVMIVKP